MLKTTRNMLVCPDNRHDAPFPKKLRKKTTEAGGPRSSRIWQLQRSIQRIRSFMSMRYINRLFTYLLTYLLTMWDDISVTFTVY